MQRIARPLEEATLTTLFRRKIAGKAPLIIGMCPYFPLFPQTAEFSAISLRVGNHHQNCISIQIDLKVKAVILIYPRLPDTTSLIVLFRFKGGVTKVRQKKAKLFVELGFEGCRERGILINRFLSKLNFSLGHEKPTSLHGGGPERPPWSS